jgi:hypothetical protein
MTYIARNYSTASELLTAEWGGELPYMCINARCQHLSEARDWRVDGACCPICGEQQTITDPLTSAAFAAQFGVVDDLSK